MIQEEVIILAKESSGYPRGTELYNGTSSFYDKRRFKYQQLKGNIPISVVGEIDGEVVRKFVKIGDIDIVTKSTITDYEKKIIGQLIDGKINSIKAEIEFDDSEYKELIKVVADNEIKHLTELKDKILA
jgi:hypothetical protein